jgi:hypothetical protein
MSATVLIVTLFLLQLVALEAHKNCGYYWTSYDGTTPSNAVEVGKTPSGETSYVGKVHLHLINKIFAGMIIPSREAAYVTYFTTVMDIQNSDFTSVEILCSDDRSGFEWVATTSNDLHSNQDTLVAAGACFGQNLYIGRVQINGGVMMGKVYPPSFLFEGLYIPHYDTYRQYYSFEVLTYRCDKKKEEIKDKKEKREEPELKEMSDIDKLIEDVFNDI